MQNNFQKISQHVDTLKFHYYISKTIEDEVFYKYISIVDDLVKLKKEAQQAKNDYADTKNIKKYFGVSTNGKYDYNFNVMPTSISGFSVVIFNNDISIAVRKSKNKINSSPVLKVEFRAEFLARKGYRKCIDIVNNFVSTHLIDDYELKISEIHLATDIQGYDFTPLDFYRMKTRSRNGKTHEEETDYSKASSFGGLTTFSGFSFGGGDYHLRVYNKSLEINKFKNKGFAKTLLWDNKTNFNPDSKVWRLEIQIRRSKLKRMVNADSSTMDNYENILNGIPSLWSKAMSDFTIKDISDKDTFNMLRGYRTLKNGTEKLLTKSAIYGIFKRSDSLPFWHTLKLWNGFDMSNRKFLKSYTSFSVSDSVNSLPLSFDSSKHTFKNHNIPLRSAYDVPKNGSFDYVSNSIKSVLSTMAKHYGSVNTQTLVQAFKEANEQNIQKKQVSLLEDSFNKQIDWFERIDFMTSNGVVDVPSYKHLETEIYQTLVSCDSHIKDVVFTHDIIDRIEARANFASKQKDEIVVKDVAYLENLINKVESKDVF